MQQSPNKITQFWQELKRRNVTRVLAVYIAAAFMILELINMISEPLGLPEATLVVAFFISLAGLVIAVVASWIYDIQPEVGVVKTEKADLVNTEVIAKTSSRWKIASYISFVVVVGLIVLNIIPRANSNRKVLEKSIAVLPLDYLSEDPNKEYLANGVLDAITGHLSLIEGLRVMPRTSVEQYRENRKSAKEIGEELDVSYLIEGSFLMIGDQVKLIIQLVVAEEGDHVFFREYDRDYKDIIDVQSEVAQAIAKEIEVAITPEEKQRIDKMPTTNLLAYEFYQKGLEQQWKYWLDNDNHEALTNAENLYQFALEYDVTFALAYTGLANIQWDRHYWDTYYSESFLDSALVLIDMALSYDSLISSAHTLKGHCLNATGKANMAIKEYNIAIELNQNDWYAYTGLADYYMDYDLVLAAERYQKAISLSLGGLQLPRLIKSLASAIAYAGFIDESIKYRQKALEIDGDSVSYYSFLNWLYSCYRENEKALKNAEKALVLDSNNVWLFPNVAWDLLLLGREEESLRMYQKWYERISESGGPSIYATFRMALAYYDNGMYKEADFYFDEQLLAYQKEKELGRRHHEILYTYLDIAAIHAFRGEKEIALENLRKFKEKQSMPIFVITFMMHEPFFDKLKDDPEFKQIIRDVEAKYQAEHERVRQWLEENDML